MFAGECQELTAKLGRVAMGEGFVLQGGDCAEAFEENTANHVRDNMRLLCQMGLILQYASGAPVIKIGRMAGQYAKPRSEPDEVRDGVALPSYRGDIINGSEFTEEARIPDPNRLLRAYNQSASTLNLLRALGEGGYADIARVFNLTLDFVRDSPEGEQFEALARRISEALGLVRSFDIDLDSIPEFKQSKIYTAHEGLLLPYEEALTRMDSITGKWYACSAHMVWLGERTRQLDGAHIEYLRGVCNPIGVKISDKATPEDVMGICDALNPENIPGRLTLVSRMSAEKLRECYPAIVKKVSIEEGRHVVWQCDPVHGNGYKDPETGYKTRDFYAIRAEVKAFFDIHEEMGTHAGGIHIECTGDEVTECVGGQMQTSSEDLARNYITSCDPRLNANQSLELAFNMAEGFRRRRGQDPLFGKATPNPLTGEFGADA